jgi:FtsH-binding integral membrane protein
MQPLSSLLLMQYAIPRSQPLALERGSEAKVYALLAVAMALTAVGVFVGSIFAVKLFSSGVHVLLLAAELGIIFTAGLWVKRSPLNVILFGVFPLLSGITVAPYLWYVSGSFVNGNAILLNAAIATTCMIAGAALFARTTSLNLALYGRFLMFAVFGLLGFGLLQFFVPTLRQSIGFEMLLSGAGIVVFAAFTAYDLQRMQEWNRLGGNPLLIAISLYLDIFNLFLYIVRFMTALSGDRR